MKDIDDHNILKIALSKAETKLKTQIEKKSADDFFNIIFNEFITERKKQMNSKEYKAYIKDMYIDDLFNNNLSAHKRFIEDLKLIGLTIISKLDPSEKLLKKLKVKI